LYGGFTLLCHHASLAKHLRPQLHHLGVNARKSILYRPHDHFLHRHFFAGLEYALYLCVVW
jgi:hypothetical protein